LISLFSVSFFVFGFSGIVKYAIYQTLVSICIKT